MSHVDKLKDLVYSHKRTVSIRDVCYSLDVHVSEARRILDDFVAEENKKGDSKLVITYIVTGSGLDSTDDYKVHKLTYAKAEELDEVKKGFETVTSCKVNSISLKDEETVLNNDDVNEPLLDRDDLLKKQKLTYIVNDDIQFRPDRLERLKLISGVVVNGSNGSNGDVKCEVKTEKKEKENKTETKKETKSSNKRTANRRNNTNNKKQGKLSGWGSKIQKSEKTNSLGDSGFSMESTPDPFSEEEEEEKSPEREEDEEMEVDQSPASPPSSPEVKVESEDEKPKRKIDDSEDEAIFMEEVKKKSKKESKKRKRVRIYDSEDEDEEAMALRILGGEDDGNSNHSSAARSSIESNKSEEPEEKPVKKPRKKSKPMETKTISEEFTDEDGYTQVRLVKKLVPVKEEDEEKKPEPTENGNDKKETNKSEKVKIDKPANKKQKTEETHEEEETKPKSKKLSKAAQAKKGQVSITSFFKPTAKV